MKIREKFGLFTEKAKASLGRFPVAFANVALFFILTFISIWSDELNDDTAKLMLVCACMAVISTAVCLWRECCGERFFKKESRLNGVLIAAECVLLVLSWFLDEYVFVRAAIGLVISGFIMSFYFISKKGKSMLYMSKALKNTAFSAFVGLVILIGGLICIAAFNTLVYSNYRLTDKLLYTHFLVCGMLVASLILILLPAADEPEENPGKAYKAVTVYAGLSIYCVLSVILYLYILRILIPNELPSGGVNPFVTTASAAYIFFIFAISGYEYESPFVRFFSRFGGYFMIPLVIIQCITLGIRIWHYGLTSARVISICFIAVTLVFIAGSIFRNKMGFGIPCLVTVGIILVMTVTPLSFDNLALWNQEYILKSTLEEAGMLKNGKIDKTAEITSAEKAAIGSAYRYIDMNSDKKPEYLDDYLEFFNEEFLWYYGSYQENEIRWYHFDNAEFAGTPFDVSEYSEILHFSKYEYEFESDSDGLYIEYEDENGDIEKYDLVSFAKQLYENEDKAKYHESPLTVKVDENVDFYFTFASFRYNSETGEISDLDISGYLLFK